MNTTYRQTALDNLGQAYAPLLDSIAERLHGNESSHLHNLTKEVDVYCWMRAEHALVALRENDCLQAVRSAPPEPQDSTAVPYGWAVWRADGTLHGYVRADQVPGVTDGWDAVFGCFKDEDDSQNREKWHVDSISEDDYQALRSHYTFFGFSGSRDEFLTNIRAVADRAAQGLPPVTGYAAWADGKLIAAHPAVRGLNGWHSLGIGNPAGHVSLYALTAEEYQHLLASTHLYTDTDGAEAFLAWKIRNSLITGGAEADTSFSPLAHAFSSAIFDHGDADYGGTPGLVLGQYLEECLSAYGAALQARQEHSR